MAETATTEKVRFLTIDQFKTEIGASSLEVLKNKKSGKLFMSASNGDTFKVEQAINPSKEMKVLVPEDGGLEEACLININGGAEAQFSI